MGPILQPDIGAVFDIPLADAIFVLCVLIGGALLLITVVLGDVVGGVMDVFHLGVDIGGVSLMPLLLAFVAMFGVGGLFATQVFGLDPGKASLVGGVTGLAGSALVFMLFSVLKRAEAPEAFSLSDLVGQTARVSVGIPAGRFGTVSLSFAGQSQVLTATAERDIPAGATVTVVGVAGSNLVVTRKAMSASGGNASA